MEDTHATQVSELRELFSFQKDLTEKLCYAFYVPSHVSCKVLELAQNTLAEVYSQSCAHLGEGHAKKKFYYDYHYEVYMGVSDMSLIATNCVIFALKLECGLKLKFSYVSPYMQSFFECDVPESISSSQKGESSKKRLVLFPRDLASPRVMHQEVCSFLRRQEVKVLEWKGLLRIFE
jgi:hypothetical protein